MAGLPLYGFTSPTIMSLPVEPPHRRMVLMQVKGLAEDQACFPHHSNGNSCIVVRTTVLAWPAPDL